MVFRSLKVGVVAALIGAATAQVHTDCQPLNRTDCPPDPAFGTEALFTFNASQPSELWQTTVGPVSYSQDNGAQFSINKQGDSPTIRTSFYFFFGRTEVWMKAAPGTGIVSSMMWLSDDLDEVDWEFLGANDTVATTNYFGKGIEDFTHGGTHDMPGGTQADFHNYTITWTKDKLEWFIDGGSVRVLTYKDAEDGARYPQTPMRMYLGIWAAGDPNSPPGVKAWAGGDTDYGAGPYSMYVQKAHVTDYSSGKEYTYGDKSGSWESIKITEGNSTAYEALHEEPSKSVNEKWNDLPTGAKVAVYAGGVGVFALAIGTLVFYYLRKKRIRERDAKLAEERAEADRVELDKLKKEGVDPDGFKEHGHEFGSENTDQGGQPPGNYGAPNNQSWNNHNAPGAAAAFAAAGAAGAAGAAAAYNSRSPTSPHERNAPRQYGQAQGPQPDRFDFGAPPPPLAQNRAASPGIGNQGQRQPPMRSQSGMTPYNKPEAPIQQTRSATADPYARMGSPAVQQGYGAPRMQNRAPMGQPGQPGGYGAPPRTQSPAVMRPQGYGEQQRMQSPGPMGPSRGPRGYGGGGPPQPYGGQPGRGNYQGGF